MWLKKLITLIVLFLPSTVFVVLAIRSGVRLSRDANGRVMGVDIPKGKPGQLLFVGVLSIFGMFTLYVWAIYLWPALGF